MDKNRLQRLAGLKKEEFTQDSDEANKIKNLLSKTPKKNAYNWALFQNAVEEKLKKLLDVNSEFYLYVDEGFKTTEPISMEFEQITPYYIKSAKTGSGNSFDSFKNTFEIISGIKVNSIEELVELTVVDDYSEFSQVEDYVSGSEPKVLLKVNDTSELIVFEKI